MIDLRCVTGSTRQCTSIVAGGKEPGRGRKRPGPRHGGSEPDHRDSDVDVLEATEYYKRARGQKPNGSTCSFYWHQAAAVGWDAFQLAEDLLVQPLLVVVGQKVGAFGAYRDGCEIIGRAASKKMELVVLPRVSHHDL